MTICQDLSAKIHRIGPFEGQLTSPSKVQKDPTVNNKANEKNPTSNTANNKANKKSKNLTSNSNSNTISKVKITKEGPSR